MRSGFLCVISQVVWASVSSSGAWGQIRDVPVHLSPWAAQTQKSRYRRLPTFRISDVGLGRAPYGEGPLPPAITVPSRPQPGGSPESAVLRRPAAWSARTSLLGRPPRRADGREASGRALAAVISR